MTDINLIEIDEVENQKITIQGYIFNFSADGALLCLQGMTWTLFSTIT